MPWSIQIVPDMPVVETVYSGSIAAPDLKQAIQATLRLAEIHRIHLFFGDCSALAGGHSVFDLYDFSGDLSMFSLHTKLREAILIPVNQVIRKDVEFWETACLNRGFKVRLFEDRKVALDWLIETSFR